MRIEVQNPLHPKPEGSELKKQLPKQHRNNTRTPIGPLFTITHTLKRKEGRSSYMPTNGPVQI
jgi:hypothetical protein